jgi:DNA-binding ferritin-like protein (Dps family)
MQLYFSMLTTAQSVDSIAEGRANKLADYIGDILSKDGQPLMDPMEALQAILGVFTSEANADVLTTAFTPLTRLVICQAGSIRSSFPDLIKLTLDYSESKYHDDLSYSEQDIECIELDCALAQNMQPKDFLDILFEQMNKETEGGLFAGLLILAETAEDLVEGIEENPGPIFELLLSIFGEVPETVVQAGFSVLSRLPRFIPAAVEHYSSDILQAVFPYFECENKDTIAGVCNVCYSMFENIPIETSSVTEIVGACVTLFQDDDRADSRDSFMHVFSAAISCARETTVTFYESIGPLILEYLQADDISVSNVKCLAIEAVGNAIAYCPEVLGDDVNTIIQMLLEIIANDDDDQQDLDIQQATFNSLCSIIKNNCSSFNEQIYLNILNSSVNQMRIANNNYAHTDDSNVEKICDLMTQMNKVLSLEAETLEADPAKLKAFIAENQEGELAEQAQVIDKLVADFSSYIHHPQLVSKVLLMGSALLVYTITEGVESEFPNVFLRELMSTFMMEPEDEDDPYQVEEIKKNVVSAFQIIHDLAIIQYSGFDDCCSDLLGFCIKAITRQLPISMDFTEELYRYDPELIDPANDAAVQLLKYYHDKLTNIEEFIQTICEVFGKVSESEKCLMFELFACLPSICPVPDEIVQLSVESIQLCNFTHAPEPFQFFIEMARAGQEVSGDVVQFAVSLLEAEKTKDIYYWETVSKAAVFILELHEKYPTAFDLAPILPNIVSKIPYKVSLMEGGTIVEKITKMFGTDAVIANAGEIYRGFVETLGLNDKEYNEYKISEDAFHAIVKFINLLSQSNAEFAEQIPTILGGDELKLAQFSKRTGINFE